RWFALFLFSVIIGRRAAYKDPSPTYKTPGGVTPTRINGGRISGKKKRQLCFKVASSSSDLIAYAIINRFLNPDCLTNLLLLLLFCLFSFAAYLVILLLCLLHITSRYLLYLHIVVYFSLLIRFNDLSMLTYSLFPPFYILSI